MPPEEQLKEMSSDNLDRVFKFEKKYNIYKILTVILSIFGSTILGSYYIGTKIESYNGFKSTTIDFISEQKTVNRNQQSVNVQILNLLNRDLKSSEGRKKYLNSIQVKTIENENNNIQ